MRAWLSLLLVPTCVLAQGATPTEFPAESTTLSGDALHAQFSGKVFSVKPAQGATWRLEYRANGYVFLETSQGFRDTGTWWIDGSKLCAHLQKSPGGCSDARVKDDGLYIKRISNGEVIALRAE